ncbi:hypothetical protein [Pseudomarimonas salicorniae]|uniref:Colicin import membrane protein n=1 Tax=Pseudomarimonas salicorniae TaxID=2933270 RepID=A0ABT0GFX8_9GAMM|nr:hypothetical protein [Lysobacter sp. CAU 1642]MCK7593099.1 hypothetical protein [Lysobacter sp. CAU 1642]
MRTTPKLLSVAIIALVTLGACQKSSTAVDEDVADARQDAAEESLTARKDAEAARKKAAADLASARRDGAEENIDTRRQVAAAESDAMEDKAERDYDVATTDAEGRHQVAMERCEKLKGAELDACRSAADAAQAVALAKAVAERDARLVAANNNR